MKLIILGLCILLTSICATQALRCMQGGEFTNGDIKEWGKHAMTECTFGSTAVSAVNLLVIKPSTVSLPSTEYKCYHLRYENRNNKKAGIFKGCIYKEQDVCDGVFKFDTVSEVFCSQCNEDECNSSVRFASDWKMLGLTMFAILAYLMQ